MNIFTSLIIAIIHFWRFISKLWRFAFSTLHFEVYLLWW